MVPGDVKDLATVGSQVDDLFDHAKVGRGKITFSKMPGIHKITIQDKCGGIYAAQVGE
jgi:hypothetical protein